MDDDALRIKQRLRPHKVELFQGKSIGTFGKVNQQRLVERIPNEELCHSNKLCPRYRITWRWKVQHIINMLKIELCGPIEAAIIVEVAHQTMNTRFVIFSGHYRCCSSNQGAKLTPLVNIAEVSSFNIVDRFTYQTYVRRILPPLI